MAEVRRQRPVAVVVIGVLAILFALMLLFTGVMIALLWRMEGMAVQAPSGNVPPGFEPFQWMFDHFLWFAGGQAVTGAVLLVLAVGFLRLRPWGLTGMKGFCWFTLVFLVLYSAFFLWAWVGAAGGLSPAEGTDGAPDFFVGFGLVAGILGMLFWLVPLGLVIWILGRDEIRRAFEPQGSALAGSPP